MVRWYLNRLAPGNDEQRDRMRVMGALLTKDQLTEQDETTLEQLLDRATRDHNLNARERRKATSTSRSRGGEENVRCTDAD